MRRISLEVASNNVSAIRVYEKSGFVAHKADTPSVTMNLYLENGEEHEQQA
jgi:ribosomal protein S18 acetylase RimI-like enzyme